MFIFIILGLGKGGPLLSTYTYKTLQDLKTKKIKESKKKKKIEK